MKEHRFKPNGLVKHFEGDSWEVTILNPSLTNCIPDAKEALTEFLKFPIELRPQYALAELYYLKEYWKTFRDTFKKEPMQAGMLHAGTDLIITAIDNEILLREAKPRYTIYITNTSPAQVEWLVRNAEGLYAQISKEDEQAQKELNEFLLFKD